MSDDFDVLSAIEMQAEQMRAAYKMPTMPVEVFLPDNVADGLVEKYGSLEAASTRYVLRRRSDVYGPLEEEEADE